MAAKSASTTDAEKARSDNRLVASSTPSRQPPASKSSCESESSKGSNHPLQPPSDHTASLFPPSLGISTNQKGIPNPKPYTDAQSPSADHPRGRRTEFAANDRQKQAIAWLYDYDGGPEEDDWLHVPGVELERGTFSSILGFFSISGRALLNVGALLFLSSGLLMLFGGYPILRHFLVFDRDRKAGSFFGLGGTNGSGQVPLFPGLFSLIDEDTPAKSRVWKNPRDGSSYHLVFSDEFETEGRTFWPGDDPFWEAVDLHYWVTGDYEWYSPESINTTGGYLNLWLTEDETHNLNFKSGMLQSWNKFCFQGGYIETAVVLPGKHSDEGFWPAVWMLGNLARAGYAGSTQGMWPYSYSECDVGTLANQTNPEKTAPYSAIHAHGLYSQSVDYKISFLEGQRVSACTCPGEDHPGPRHDVGRSSPEIDVFESQVYGGHGTASQSFQIAPFDANYSYSQNPDVAVLIAEGQQFNSYTGGVYQEAVSAISKLPDTAYAKSGDIPVRMGVQYDPDWKGDGSGSITWFTDGKPTWTLSGKAIGPNQFTEIGQRLIPREPVSIVINLALSDGFQRVNWKQVEFPAVMKLDYVRVYQRDGQPDRISCDPPDHPTAKYIQDHLDVYTNINYTVFPQEKYPWPKNRFLGQC